MAGILLLGAAPAGFNNGRSQVNLNNAQQGFGQFDWVNVCLYGSNWGYGSGQNQNEALPPNLIDANGYPLNPLPTNVGAGTQIPSQAARPGNYVMRYLFVGTGQANTTNPGSAPATGSFTGVLASGVLTVSGLTGSIFKGQALAGTGVNASSAIGDQLSASTYQIYNYVTGINSTQSLASVAMTAGNGSTTVTAASPGRLLFTPAATTISFGINSYSGGTGQLTLCACMHIDDEQAWVANPYAVGRKLLARLIEGNFGVLRDLNWINGIASLSTTWSTRKPMTYFSWGGSERRPSLFAGTTTAASGTSITLSSISYAQATFTGSIATTPSTGTVLTVASGLTGTIEIGSCIGGGTPQTAIVLSQLTGSAGGLGTYQLDFALGTSLNVGSRSMTAGIVTAVTSSPHGQTGSFFVSIDSCRGASQITPNFNGTFKGTVVDTTTFTYPLRDSPGASNTVLGKANFGVYDYSLSFSDPIYGSGAPVDKQTIHLFFDAAANAAFSAGISFSGVSTCQWPGHPFTGGEMVVFTNTGGTGIANTNAPGHIGGAQTLYVLSTGLVAGTSFKFATTPGGTPVVMTNGGTTFTGSIASGVLTVTSPSSTINLNCGIVGVGVQEGSVITSQLTGTTGGAGTYQLNTSQTLGSVAMCQSILIGVRQPTLNLNGTGAKPIFSTVAAPLMPPPLNFAGQSTGTMPNPQTQFGQVSLGTAVYDSDYGGWLLAGACMAGGSGLPNWVPPEAFVSLCNQIGAHPHFTVPPYALDPVTDYPIGLDQLVRSTASWMIPRYEPTNEVWNTLRQNTNYAGGKAFLHWDAQFSNGNSDWHNWYGKAASTLGQTIAAARSLTSSGVGTGYMILIGVQTATFSSAGSNGSSARFISTLYTTQSQSAQSSLTALGVTVNFTKDPANTWCTHSAGANYLNPSNFNNAAGITQAATYVANAAFFTGSITSNVLTVTSLSNNGTIVTGQTLQDFYGYMPASGGYVIGSQLTGAAGGVGTYNVNQSPSTTLSMTMWSYNSTALTAVDAYLDTMAGVAANYNLARVLQFFTNLYNYGQTLTNGAGVALGSTCYEGGYGPDFPGGDRDPMFRAAKFRPDLGKTLTGGTFVSGDVVNGNYNDLISLGVIFPSAFEVAQISGPWSLFDPDMYADTAIPLASFNAIKAFNGH